VPLRGAQAGKLTLITVFFGTPASITLRVRTSTASLSNTSATGARPLASSVAPVETRSQMNRAMPSRGASSTAPRIVTTSASISRSARNLASSRG